MEFWNVSAAGAWESTAVANKYAIGLIDNRLAGRQYPDMYGEPPDSPYYHENDPEALRRSKQWEAQYGHN